MKRFLSKTQSEVTLGDSILFIMIYTVVYLAIMGIILKLDEVVEGVKTLWTKIKNFFKKLKTKLIG